MRAGVQSAMLLIKYSHALVNMTDMNVHEQFLLDRAYLGALFRPYDVIDEANRPI